MQQDLNDEQLRETFAHCGQIESVRIVRDQKTRMGKGFGFVQFKVRFVRNRIKKISVKILIPCGHLICCLKSSGELVF